MKRLLVLVFLFVVPLQFSYAAIAAYCEHEPAPALVTAGHLGHHAHQHEADSGSAGDERIPPGKLDPDCAQCHLVHFNLVAPVLQPLLPDVTTVAVPFNSQFILLLLRDTLFRPPLLALA